MKEPLQLDLFKKPKRWERIGGIAFDLGALATIILIALWVIGMLIPKAHAHSFYMHWTQPDNGASCCNGDAKTGDCKPVKARFVGNHWEVWIPELQRWDIVPPNKVLDPAKYPPPDGSYHGCYTLEGYDQKSVWWYCFNPGRTDF